MKRIVIICLVFCRLTAMSEDECKEEATYIDVEQKCEWQWDILNPLNQFTDPFAPKLGEWRFICRTVPKEKLDRYVYEKCLKNLKKERK